MAETTNGWASPEDFATLFCYFWHCDFPITHEARGARAADWNIHTGVIVRNIADLMGLKVRFESVNRMDAVMWSADHKPNIALEWEWKGAWENEMSKLKKLAGQNAIRYCVFITYNTRKPLNMTAKYVYASDSDYEFMKTKWTGAARPLLFILVNFKKTAEYATHRTFTTLDISLIEGQTRKAIRQVKALPWEIPGTWWSLT